MPNSYLSNCIREAIRSYRAISAGGELGDESYIWMRPSRSKNGAFHMGTGKLDPATGMMVMSSFRPTLPVPVPWWLMWTRLRFRGTWGEGDDFVVGAALARAIEVQRVIEDARVAAYAAGSSSMVGEMRNALDSGPGALDGPAELAEVAALVKRHRLKRPVK